MKTILMSGIIFVTSVTICASNALTPPIDSLYRDITSSFSIQEFENIKNYILTNGDRETYCQMYGDNPHYKFNDFEAYLNPSTGQKNVKCDPHLSDFNELILRDIDSIPQYYTVCIVRKGDIENDSINVNKQLTEERVYLAKIDNFSLDLLENSIKLYLQLLKEQIATRIIYKSNQRLFLSPTIQYNNGSLILNLQSNKNDKCLITILSIQGKIFYNSDLAIKNGINKAFLKIPKLSNGIWVCRIIGNNFNSTIAFVKK